MWKRASFLALLTTFSAATASPENSPLRIPRDACTVGETGSPRTSAGIGIAYSPSVPREVVESAVDLWAACEGYEAEFPAFFVGRPGSQTVFVRHGGRSRSTLRCGSFDGASIVLYSSTLDPRGRLVSCGPPVELLAHELGHVLGLRDAPRTTACSAHAMARIHNSVRTHHRPQPEECRAVAQRWVTPQEAEGPPAPRLVVQSVKRHVE